MKSVKFLLLFLGMVLILSTSYDLIFNPTLFVDEGYYIGATKALMNGDPFLTRYIFDKSFLLAFWPIPGILVLGENQVGFRLVAILLYLSSFVMMVQVLEFLSKNFLRNFLIALILFSLPLVQRHGISVFCEPYLVFCLIGFIYAMVRHESIRKISNWFFAATFTKFSMVLWSPIIAFDFWMKGPKNRTFQATKNYIFSFLKEAKILWALWFFYSLTNAVKFGNVTWFSGLSTDVQRTTSWVERSVIWSKLLWNSFSSPGVALVSIGIFIFGATYAVKRKHTQHLMWFWLPTVLYFLSFIVSGVRFYDRYLVTFLPVFFICIALAISYLENFKKWIRFPIYAALLMAAMNAHQAPKYNEGGSPQLGREIYTLRDELNRPKVVLRNAELWKTSAFSDRLITTGCSDTSCFREPRIGGAIQSYEYAFVRNRIWRGPLSTDPTKVTTKTITIPLSKEELAAKILHALKLGRATQITKVMIETSPQAVSPEIGDWRYFASPVGLVIQSVSKKNLPFQQAPTRAEVSGRFIVNELHDDGKTYNRPRYTLVFQVDLLQIGEHDLTDMVLPLFIGSYAIPVATLPIDWKENRVLNLQEYHASDSTMKFTLSEAK